MTIKPEKIIKRIIKAVGQRQAVLVIGDWDESLIKGIQGNQNSLSIEPSTENLESNSFTRIIADYSHVIHNDIFFTEARRLLLPTGMLIVSANCELNIFERLFNNKKEENIKKIKPKVLQNQIHDNGFLIDGYYG